MSHRDGSYIGTTLESNPMVLIVANDGTVTASLELKTPAMIEAFINSLIEMASIKYDVELSEGIKNWRVVVSDQEKE